MLKTLKLKNNKGEVYDLLDTSSVCMALISGFGFDEAVNYIEIGSRHKPTRRRIKQKSLSGTLAFNGSEPYRDYYDFVRFLRNAPLVLVYETFSTFYLDIDATEITKAELTEDGQLQSKIRMDGRSLWYRVITRYIEPVEPSNDNVYPYVYSHVYPAEQIGYVLLESDSVGDSPTKITIFGEAINPVWRHYLNGKLVASGSYEGTIAAGHKLVIDATTIPYSIIEYDGNSEVVADRYALCDFSTQRFLYLQNGRNMISVSHDGTTGLALSVEGRLEYASV